MSNGVKGAVPQAIMHRQSWLRTCEELVAASDQLLALWDAVCKAAVWLQSDQHEDSSGCSRLMRI